MNIVTLPLVIDQYTLIKQSQILYIASYFKVEKFHDCKTKLQFAGRHSWLDVSLVALAKAYCTDYFTGKVSRLSIHP